MYYYCMLGETIFYIYFILRENIKSSVTDISIKSS